MCLKFRKTKPSPEECRVVLLAIVEQLREMTSASERGDLVFLRHPYRLARAIKRSFGILNAAAAARRATRLTVPAERYLATTATKMNPPVLS